MEDTFTTAGIFPNSQDAHLFRTKLESAGITAFVDFDNSSGTGFLEASGLSGIRVRIYNTDKVKALKVLEEFKSKNQDYLDHLNGPNIKIKGKYYRPWSGYCPNCDHDKVYLRKNSFLMTLLAILTLGIITILLFGPKDKLCLNCNHKWVS